MRYVLGMAKSSLDTRGGKGRNLELDFVRLVLAVRTCIAIGEELAERALRTAIRRREEGLMPPSRGEEPPLGVRWDYFGVADGEHALRGVAGTEDVDVVGAIREVPKP